MENAVDALKIAFAVFVFVIALALALSVIGQVRATSDVILALSDKTNAYDYVEVNENANKDRIVGFETILPTIYRYPLERYAVTILNIDGTPIVRYDLFTENYMNEWDNTLKKMNSPRQDEVQDKFNSIKDRIAIVDNMLKTEFNDKNYQGIWDSLVNESNYTSGTLYEVNATGGQNITQGAPWVGDTNEILKRIKADLATKSDEQIYTRDKIITYKGKNLNQLCVGKKFKEKFIEIQISGTTITEDEYSLETVKGSKTLEIVYIMQPQP